MILLDTHTLIWWANSDKDSLPHSVFSLIQNQHEKREIYVSAISFWEIAHLYRKNKIQLKSDLNTWVDTVLSIPSLKPIATDVKIFLNSNFLKDFPHKDPADRIIIATAQTLGATLISKDEKILNYPHVQTFWKE